MAGILAQAVTGEVAIAKNVTKTPLQIVAAANHRIKVSQFGIFFKGVAVTDPPVLVKVVRQTDAGTTSALTPVKNNTEDGETLQTTARHTATAEPTTTDVVYSAEVHPQSGWQVIFPFGQEIIVPGGTRLGISVSTHATIPDGGHTCVAFMAFEE
jgi:hypothetical protein